MRRGWSGIFALQIAVDRDVAAKLSQMRSRTWLSVANCQFWAFRAFATFATTLSFCFFVSETDS
jgi:hypothetical protein